MTTPLQEPIRIHNGNGASTSFSYDFEVGASDEMVAFVDGVEKTEGVDYTVTGVGVETGGTVVFTVAPATGTGNVVIYRDTPVQRTAIQYQTSGDFFAATVNEDVDRVYRILQELRSIYSTRSLRVPIGSVLAELTGDPADFEGYYIGIGAGGVPGFLLAPTGTAASVVADLVDTSSVANGDAKVGVKRTFTGAAATTAHAVTELQQIRARADVAAPADGSTDARAALAIADAAAVAAGSSLILEAGTYKINSAITFAAPLVFQPGTVLKPANGVTITLAKHFEAPMRQIFDLSLGGVIVLPDYLGGGQCVVPAEWWGAKGDLVKVNNEVPINQAMLAVFNSVGAGTVTLSGAYYVISGELVSQNHVELVGDAQFYTVITADLSGFPAPGYMFRAQNGTSSMFENPVRRIRFNCNHHSNVIAAIYGPAWQQRGGTDGVYIENFRNYGIQLDTGYGGATQLRLARTEIFASPNCFPGASCILADYSGYTVGWMSLALEEIQCGSAAATVTFTAGLAAAATSGTLAVAWPYPTGAWNVNFSNGDWRLVTLTNGATTATWSTGLSGAATSAASGHTPHVTGINGSGRVLMSARDIHFEGVQNGFVLATGATLVGDTVKSGGSNDTQILFNCSGSWTGNIRLSGVKKAGATTLIVDTNRNFPFAALEPYDGELVWPPAADKAIAMGRITGGGAPAFAWQQGTVSMTVVNQATGSQRVTLSTGFLGTDYYDVEIHSGDSGAPMCNWVPVSGTQFDCFSRNSAGVGTNSSVLSVKVFARP